MKNNQEQHIKKNNQESRTTKKHEQHIKQTKKNNPKFFLLQLLGGCTRWTRLTAQIRGINAVRHEAFLGQRRTPKSFFLKEKTYQKARLVICCFQPIFLHVSTVFVVHSLVSGSAFSRLFEALGIGSGDEGAW